MITINWFVFILFSAFDILCLTAGGYIIKKYIRQFPNKLIPLLNTILSCVVGCLWTIAFQRIHNILFYGYIGFMYGLSSVGLHQLFKQTLEYIRIKLYVKKNKKTSKIVSMSD